MARYRKLFSMTAIAIGLFALPMSAYARRVGDAYILTAGGGAATQFCTQDGLITVVHNSYSDANGGVGWGSTLLQGPQTYYLGPGNARIVPGCYSHMMANMTVWGTGQATSTVWYNQ